MIQAKPYLQEIYVNDEIPRDESVFPFTVSAIRNLKSLRFHADVTCLVGENGMGKSTLLEALARAFGAETETLSFPDGTAGLHRHLRCGKSYLKPDELYYGSPERFYTQRAAGNTLTCGEAFMQTITHRLQGGGLYFFDEPEAGLSPSRQLNALIALDKLVKKQSQIIMATQSPLMLAYPNAKIYKLDQEGIREIWYHNTEHYRVGQEFMNYPEEMLRVILKF